ncbi:DinB family protein [Salinimicrobium marinum]|nr:DinB family protein [Salinimicrobium marinum]
MKTSSEALLADLKERTRLNVSEAAKFRELSSNELNQRETPGSWTVLENLEHLNYYGNFYLPEIEKRISESKHDPEDVFKSGIFGNYFANMMLLKEKPKKIKTFKSQDPIGKSLDKAVIDQFLQQQERLLELLVKAGEVSLTRTKTSISISNWLKLRLGDTVRVVVYHNQRHVLQARNVLKTLKTGSE